MRYVGLDVHKRTARACILDAAGKQVFAGDLACTREGLEAFARQHLLADDRVALEATTNTGPSSPRLPQGGTWRARDVGGGARNA